VRRRGRHSLTCVVSTVAGVALAVALVAVSSQAASTRRCVVRQLRAALAREGVAMGTVVADFALINDGSHACALEGYARLQMLDGSGHDVATVERRAPIGSPGAGAGQEVTIAPGGRAHLSVSYEDQTGFGYAVCPRATTLSIRAPGVSGALILRGPQARIQPYGGSRIKQLRCGELSVGPARANAL